MKKITFILLILSLSLSLSTAFAGTQNGKVSFIKIRTDGTIKIGLDTVWTDFARCRTKEWWIISDENSVAGKAQLSLLMTAYASGRTVKIGGFPDGGICTRTTGLGEDIYNVNLSDF